MSQTVIVVCPDDTPPGDPQAVIGCGTTFTGILDSTGRFTCPWCELRFIPERAGLNLNPDR